MNTVLNVNMSKKDLVKAKVTTETFKDYKEKKLTLIGGVIYDSDSVDETTGEVKQQRVSAVKIKDGDSESIIASISKTVTDSLDVILSEFTEEELTAGLEIIIKEKTSNGGRDFLYIDLI